MLFNFEFGELAYIPQAEIIRINKHLHGDLGLPIEEAQKFCWTLVPSVWNKDGSNANQAGYSTSAANMKTLLTLCLTCIALTSFAQNRPAAPPPPPPPAGM